VAPQRGGEVAVRGGVGGGEVPIAGGAVAADEVVLAVAGEVAGQYVDPAAGGGQGAPDGGVEGAAAIGEADFEFAGAVVASDDAVELGDEDAVGGRQRVRPTPLVARTVT